MDGAVGSVADTLSQSWDALRREIQVFRVKPGQREAELLWQMRALLVKVRAGQMLKPVILNALCSTQFWERVKLGFGIRGTAASSTDPKEGTAHAESATTTTRLAHSDQTQRRARRTRHDDARLTRTDGRFVASHRGRRRCARRRRQCRGSTAASRTRTRT